MQHWLWWCIAFLIVIIFIMWHQHKNIEKFTDNTFITEHDMYKVVQESPYFDRMNNADLFARGASSNENYKHLYLKGLRTFTEREKVVLNELTDRIDIRLGTRAQRLQALPWKFAKVATEIERGWPHTLQDVIVVSTAFFEQPYDSQMETLLHEKVHIYQRMHPDLTMRLIVDEWGFEKVQKVSNDILSIVRNNPDIVDLYTFKGRAYAQIYNHSRPSTIAASRPMSFLLDSPVSTMTTDVSALPYPAYVTQVEHPYEAMAVIIARIMLRGVSDDNEFEKRTMIWCMQYL